MPKAQSAPSQSSKQMNSSLKQISKHLPNTSNTSMLQTCKSTLNQLYKKFQSLIISQLRLKQLIHHQQKLDFLPQIQEEDKLYMKQFLYVNLFVLINGLGYGTYKFSKKQYRNFRSILGYGLVMTYLGLTVGILWEDEVFLTKISTRQDAYKSQIKYVMRKKCLENLLELERIKHRKETFLKLNQEFQQFHQLTINKKTFNLLP